MRKPEQMLWDDLKKVMDRHWIANRIETDASRDIPDVYFRFASDFTGWIELKQIDAWNKRNEDIVRVPTLTMGQKIWLRDNFAAGANTWLLLWVQRSGDYLFVPGNKVPLIGDLTRFATERAGFMFHGMPSYAVIREVLKKGRKV